MTTPGGVPNLPMGALTLETIASNLHDMTTTAMKSRAVERFPSIFNNSTGLNPALEITPFGILTTIWAQVNSLIANADPADIQGPDDLPDLVLEFIEGLPFVGQYISLLEAILGTYDGDDENLLFVQEIFAPIRKLMELITGLEGIPGVADLTAGWDSLGLGQIADLIGLFPGLLDNGDGTLSSILDGLFTDNGDGTWSFIDNGINTLFDLGDGTLASPAGALLNLLGQLGTFQATINRQQAIIDSLFNAVHYTDIFGTQVESLLEALRNIPSLNVLGVGGPTNIGTSILEALNQIVGGAVGAVGSGASFPDVFNVLNIVSGGAFLGRTSWDTLSIRANKPLWGGLLPTGVSNIPLPSLTSTTAPTYAVTQSTATMGYHRIDEGSSKSVVSWIGSGTTSITHFFVNIFKVDPATGVHTLVHASPNMAGDVSSALGTNVYTLNDGVDDTPIDVLPGEVYGIEFAVRGAGTHSIVGGGSWMNFDHPTVFPKRLASVRNSGTSAAPSTIAAGSVAYSANIPFTEFAVSSGADDGHSAEPRTFTVVGTTSTVVPTWADVAEVVVVGSGGHGAFGSTTIGINGKGGEAGVWGTGTWLKGTHFSAGDTINIVVAGNAAIDGATSSATVGANTVSGVGGVHGPGWDTDTWGVSPGDQDYGTPTQTYVGGAQQNTLGAAGSAPGGGGAGGGYFQAGGVGARGQVWIRFRKA